MNRLLSVLTSVVEEYHFYVAPAPGVNFDAAPAPAPSILYSNAKFKTHVEAIFYI
jgi:hypothetical protein